MQKEEYKEHFSIKSFKEQLVDHKISLAFQGMFSQDVLTLIGKSLKATPDSRVVAKRLFAIVIEMAQNIHHYSAQKQFSEKDGKEIGLGVVTVGHGEDYHVVSSGNYINKEDCPPLIERAEYINGLSAQELKDFYREQRKAPQRKNKPGANLGFIDMVRKSGNPISVQMIEVDDKFSFFTLTVKINKEL